MDRIKGVVTGVAVGVLAFKLEAGRAKIEQEPNVNSGGSEVVDGLDLVGGSDRLNRLEFDDNHAFDEQIRCKVAHDGRFVDHAQ